MPYPMSGSFVPTTQQSMRLSMAGDDCSLHFDLTDLTTKQQEDHYSNQVLTGMLQIALLYIAKANDEVCLYDTFCLAPWQDALHRYRQMFTDMHLSPVSFTQVSYHPFDNYYPSVADTPRNSTLENLYMVSGSNWLLHKDAQLLEVSRNLNSKVHFAQHAPASGIEVPDTMLTTKAELRAGAADDFLTHTPTPLMLKILGLAGARNVTTVNTKTEALNYVEEFEDDLAVILQHRLDAADYTEMTVDLFVSDHDIHVTNVRQIMFADGVWVGNLMGSAVGLPEHHAEQLLRVGEYALTHGYRSDIGFNLGIDYFVRNPTANPTLPEIVVTEINARWTGGLFPAELVRRLGVTDKPVVAFIDMCPPEDFDRYLQFLEDHLHGRTSSPFSIAPFSIAPMGFAPFVMNAEDYEFIFVWQIVIGDFDQFKKVKQDVLGDQILPTVSKMSVSL
jgi:hypothetical protein